MDGSLGALLSALPPAEAKALRESAPADLAAAIRYLAEGPEDSFRDALDRLPADALEGVARLFLASKTDRSLAGRLLELPVLGPALPRLVSAAKKDALPALLPALAAARTPAAVAAAAAALDGLKPSRAARDAVIALAWTGERPLFPLFQRLLQEKKPDDRRAGMDGIARGAGPGDVALLRKAVEAEIAAQTSRKGARLDDGVDDFEALGRALERLHEIGAPPDVALVRRLLKLPTADPVAKTLEVLLRFERRDLIGLFEEALKSRSDQVRAPAFTALARMGDTARRMSLLARFAASPLTFTGEVLARVFAETGMVDAIPILEPFRIGEERLWTVHGDAIARLELARHQHGLVSRDHVRGRLAQLEAELSEKAPGVWTRGPVLLDIHRVLGDRGAFDELRGRLEARYGFSSERLAREVPDPAFLPALRAKKDPSLTDLALRALCGDAEAVPAIEAALDAKARLTGLDLASLPAGRRLDAWRRLHARIEPSWRAEAVDALGAEIRDVLPAIAADPEEIAHVRNRAAWHASRPVPANPPLIRLPAAEVEALRNKLKA